MQCLCILCELVDQWKVWVYLYGTHEVVGSGNVVVI